MQGMFGICERVPRFPPHSPGSNLPARHPFQDHQGSSYQWGVIILSAVSIMVPWRPLGSMSRSTRAGSISFLVPLSAFGGETSHGGHICFTSPAPVGTVPHPWLLHAILSAHLLAWTKARPCPVLVADLRIVAVERFDLQLLL